MTKAEFMHFTILFAAENGRPHNWINPESDRVYGEEFMVDLQELHDTDHYWNSAGELSERGLMESRDIVEG